MIEKWIFNPVGAVCNLRCTYCHSGFLHNVPADSQVISREKLTGVLDKIREFGARKVYIHWHGGEPLLAGKDFYKFVLREQLRIFPAGTEIYNSMTTNGMLLDDEELIDIFGKNNFALVVSLDGINYEQCRFRFKNRKQYNRVMSNIRLMCRLASPPDICVVVNSQNYRHAADICRYFAEMGISQLKLLPCLHRCRNGALSEFTISPEQYSHFLVGLFDEWMELDAPFVVALFTIIFRGIATGEFPTCFLNARCSTVHIENDGSLYGSCNVTTAETRLGNMLTDSLETLIGHFRDFNVSTISSGDIRAAILDGVPMPPQPSPLPVCPYYNEKSFSYFYTESYHMLSTHIRKIGKL